MVVYLVIGGWLLFGVLWALALHWENKRKEAREDARAQKIADAITRGQDR